MARNTYALCFGEFDGSGECTGDKDSTSQRDREPCHDCYDCKLFRDFSEKNKVDCDVYMKIDDGNIIPNQTIPIHGPKKFEIFLSNLRTEAEAKRIKEMAKPGITDKRRLGPKRHTKLAAARALNQKAKSSREEMTINFNTFKERLSHKIDLDIAPLGQTVGPGQLYAINKLNSSGYIALYCFTVRGRDCPLVKVVFKTKTRTFDIALPIDLATLKGATSNSEFKRLKYTIYNDGSAFKVVARKSAKLEMALMVETIGHLVKRGIISLL